MYNPFLVSSLKKCETGEAVDAIFAKKKIVNPERRTEYLSHCMGNPQILFAGVPSPDNDKELHSKYLTVRSMFITGSWR